MFSARQLSRSSRPVFFKAQAASYNLTVLADKQIRPWDHFIERGIATDHMAGAIMTAYGRGWGTTLDAAYHEGGINISRGHGILNDEIGGCDCRHCYFTHTEVGPNSIPCITSV